MMDTVLGSPWQPTGLVASADTQKGHGMGGQAGGAGGGAADRRQSGDQRRPVRDERQA